MVLKMLELVMITSSSKYFLITKAHDPLPTLKEVKTRCYMRCDYQVYFSYQHSSPQQTQGKSFRNIRSYKRTWDRSISEASREEFVLHWYMRMFFIPHMQGLKHYCNVQSNIPTHIHIISCRVHLIIYHITEQIFNKTQILINTVLSFLS